MGNYVTYQSSNATGKVILSDGRVHEFDKPLTVAELMLEYPQEVVVEFHPSLTQRRPNPLPADMKLDIKKVYLMLPIKRGRPASLSSEEARHVLLSANSVLRSKSTRLLMPLLARMCTAGTGEGHKIVLQKKEYIEKEEEKKKPVEMCAVSEFFMEEILGSRPEYLTRQVSGKGWKPSLDTITERKIEKKVPHWLF